MEKHRCDWAEGSDRLLKYHDERWRNPCHDNKELFKMLTLEIFQAGLAWDTVLKFESGLTEVFKQFDVQKVSQTSLNDQQKMYEDKRIIRNHAKIDATIANAQAIESLEEDGSDLNELVWGAFREAPLDLHGTLTELTAIREFTKPLCKTFKQLGFLRVGPTTCFSFLQAVGVVNDHRLDCYRHQELLQ